MLVSICKAKKFLRNWSVDSWTTVEITRYVPKENKLEVCKH